MQYLLTIAYLGTHYCGWQVQPNGPTIQSELMSAGAKFIKLPFSITGASRTDSGVHALGQRAVLRVDGEYEIRKIRGGFNAFLPKDIAILKVEAVDESFHPRYSSLKKKYTYDIQFGDVPIPFLSDRTWHIDYDLDLESMRRGARYFLGEHDFRSFCSVRTDVESTVRTIYTLDIIETEFGLRFNIEGNGFLYNMVRIIVGTLIKVGSGRIQAESIPEIINTRSRKAAGPTAPAHGLTLDTIYY